MLSRMFEWLPASNGNTKCVVTACGGKVQSTIEDYDIYIAPESGVYEYGPGRLKAVQAPTLDDGRAFADYFIQRQLEEQGINREPIPLIRKKSV